MKFCFSKIITILLLFFSFTCFSQSFSIDGVTGITFTESSSDYTITSTDDFTAFGVEVLFNNVTVAYTAENNSFAVTGDVDLEFDNVSVNSTMNFTIENREIQEMKFSVNGDFDLYQMDFSPQSLTFSWDSVEEYFEMYGELDVTFDGKTVAAGLGDDSNPGITVQNGNVQSLNLSLTAAFEINGLTFTPSNLTMQYDFNDSNYKMFGEASVAFDGNTLDLVLGDDTTPGIDLNNGVVESVLASVTADFEVHGLSFTPTDLTFQYDSVSSHYEMFGETAIAFDANSVDVVLGDDAIPGIVINGSTLTSLNASVTADFEVHGLSFTPNNLTFQYDSASSHYEMFGEAAVAFDGNSVDLVLGDDTAPGIVINGSTLTSLNASVTADFEINGLSFAPTDLTFQYDSASEHYEMFGETKVAFDGNSLDVVLGDDATPGIVIDNGSLVSLDMSFTADFTVGGLTFTPDNLTFIYNKSSSFFEMYGLATVILDGNEISLNLGDVSAPGIVFQSGIIEEINASITSDFKMKSIDFNTKDLGFQYVKNANRYEIYGSAGVSFDNESIEITMGTKDSPGFLFYDNEVQEINLDFTGDFNMKKIEITPENLDFNWDRAKDHFKMYGNLKSKIEGNVINLHMGTETDPGLTISNGVVQNINMGVTADFTFNHMEFKPEDLTFVYNRTGDLFEMYGTLDVTFDNETLDVHLGDANTPGFKLKDNVVESIDIGVTADFKMKDLDVTPTDLTFIYSKNGRKFEMYGDIKISFSGNVVESNLGNVSDPGLLFENAKIQHVNISISEDFRMSGLEIKTNGLGVDWNRSDNVYHVYGDADLQIASERIDTSFGTFNDPGFIIRDGHWHYFNVDINADFKIGNLEIIAKDLDVIYNGNYVVTGELEVKEVFTLAVTLGHHGQGGLFIDISGATPKFKLEDFTIDIEHANLGAIDLKQIKLQFNNDGIVESDVKVVFPEGWEVDATMKFRDIHGKAELDEIDIAYNADNLSDAIEIFEGVQLTHLEGDVKNLTRPSELEVSASIGTIYGGGFSLAGRSATFLAMNDAVTISRKEFKIDGDVYVGAYRTGTNSWHSILGSGSIDLEAYFGHYVKARVDARYPGNPLIEANLTAYMDNHGHFDGLLDVEFIVPHWVPFIGGKHYGSVDGAVRYKKGDLNGSFGAAWVRVHTFWHTYHPGAKYTFGSRHINSIGNGSEDWIRRVIRDDESKSDKKSNGNSNYVYTFELPQPAPSSVLVSIDWEDEVEEAGVTVLGPEGNYELLKGVITSQNAIDETPTIEYEENMTIVKKDTVTNFFFASPSSMNTNEQIRANLVDGRYQVVLSFPNTASAIDTIQIQPIWQAPESTITVNQVSNDKFELDVNYWSAIPDSTLVSFYVNNVNSYEEGRLINHVKASSFDEFGYGKETLTFEPTTFYKSTSDLYFYAVIEDGINPPFQSSITTAYTHEPDLKGTITLNSTVTDLDLEGLRIYIDINDNKNFDTASTGGIEPFGLTNENGYFSIPNITVGTYNLRIVLPIGYRIVGEIDNRSSITYTFNNIPLELNIQIEKY